MTGLVTGSSATDLWFLTARDGQPPKLWRHDGSAWTKLSTPMAVADFGQRALESAGAGAVWLQLVPNDFPNSVFLYRISSDGTIEDRSTDLLTGSPTLPALVSLFRTHDGSVYSQVIRGTAGATGGEPQEDRLFKLSDGRATLLRDLPCHGTIMAVFSDADMWLECAPRIMPGIGLRGATMRLQGDAWVPVEIPQMIALSYTSPSDVWIHAVPTGGVATFDVFHFDGASFTAQAVSDLAQAKGETRNRYGIVALGSRSVALLSAHFVNPGDSSYTHIESERWDTSAAGEAHVIIEYAGECSGGATPCAQMQAPVRARLTDGTTVHAHIALGYGDDSRPLETPRLLLGSAGDY